MPIGRSPTRDGEGSPGNRWRARDVMAVWSNGRSTREGSMTPPTRRDMLRMGLGAVAGACAGPLLGGCTREAVSAPAPVACLPGESATVVAVRGTDLAAMT